MPTHSEVIRVVLVLCFLVGMITFVFGLLRFGFLDNILSLPILRGFITAVAITIALEQIDVLFGIHVPERHGWDKAYYVISHWRETHIITLGMGVTSVSILLAVSAFKQNVKGRTAEVLLACIPEILIVVAVAILITKHFGLDEKGLKILGRFDGQLHQPAFPEIDLRLMQALFQPAFIITIVGFVESVIIAKSYGAKHNYVVSANRELVALGLANLVGSCFGTFPCFGSIPRSAVNDRAGAKTGIATLISAFVVLGTIQWLLPLFTFLPKVVMAGIIITAAIGLFEIKEIRFLVKIRAWKDLLIVLGTAVITISFGLELGLLISILFSLFSIIKHSTTPTMTIRGRIPNTSSFQDIKVFRDINIFNQKHNWFGHTGILIIRIEESLYFANIGTVIET